MRTRSKITTTLLLVLAGSGCGAIKGLTGKVKGVPKPPEAITKNTPPTPVTGDGGGEKLRDYDGERELTIQREKREKRKVPAGEILVGEPGPGLEKVEPMSPAWCKGIVEQPNVDGHLLRRMFDNQLGGSMGVSPGKAMSNLGRALCENPNDEGWKKMTAYLVQYWVNETGLSKKDAIAAIGARIDYDEWTRQEREFCAAYKVGDEAEMSPEDIETGKALGEQLGCDERNSDFLWYADREEAVPELLRATIVNDNFLPLREGQAVNVVPYIIFGPDARRLDPSKLEKEITGAPFNDYGRTKAREAHGKARKLAREYKAAVDRILAKDPDLKELYLDAPERAWAGWVKERAAHKTELDAASAVEPKLFAASRKTSAGCGEKLGKLFGKYLASKSPKSYDDALAAAIDPVGYALLSRLMVCEAFDKNDGQAYAMRRIVESAPRHRGPRTAVIGLTIQVLNKIREDRPKLPLDPGALPRIYNDDLSRLVDAAAGDYSASEVKRAVVKSVKEQGRTVRVEFATETWQEPNMICKPTNRIYRIHDNGFIEYAQSCVQKGMMTVSHTEKPVGIPAGSAAGVKSGRLLVFAPVVSSPEPGGNVTAAVFAVHEGTARKQIFNFLGFPL